MIKKIGLIYKVTNLLNNKVYIGQTIQSLKERKRQHYKFAKKRHNYKFSNALNKYTTDSFLWEIIEDNILIENLNDKEVYYINLYNSYNKGYNSTPGKYDRFIRGCTKLYKQTFVQVYNTKTNKVLNMSKCDFMSNIVKGNNLTGASRMLNDKLIRYYDWILYKNYDKYVNLLKNNNIKTSNRFADTKLYTIININTNEIFKGSRKDFINKIKISASGMHNLIKNYNIKVYKNWKIIEIKDMDDRHKINNNE
jgi:hypothetical protein